MIPEENTMGSKYDTYAVTPSPTEPTTIESAYLELIHESEALRAHVVAKLTDMESQMRWCVNSPAEENMRHAERVANTLRDQDGNLQADLRIANSDLEFWKRQAEARTTERDELRGKLKDAEVRHSTVELVAVADLEMAKLAATVDVLDANAKLVNALRAANENAEFWRKTATRRSGELAELRVQRTDLLTERDSLAFKAMTLAGQLNSVKELRDALPG